MKTILSLICLLSFATVLHAQKAGTLDKSFGDTGVVINKQFAGTSNDIALLSNGKIIQSGLSAYLTLTCYNTDGSVNDSFGTDGVSYYTSLPQALAIAVDSDDDIYTISHTISSSVILKYKSNGNLDSSFGTGGSTFTYLGYTVVPADVAVQIDGKIVVGGYLITAENESNEGYLIRYLPDGSLDESFGDNGIVIVNGPNPDNPSNQAYAIAILQNGKILFSVALSSGSVYRFNTDGSLDKSFGNGGIAFFHSVGDLVRGFDAYDLVIQPDGKIVGTGYAEKKGFNGGEYMAAARLNADGSVDSSFGANGLVYVLFGGEDQAEARSILLQKDGKLITAGTDLTYSYFALAHFNTDGTVDSTFGNRGLQTASVGYHDQCTSAVLQKDEKIILGGSTYIQSPFASYFALARYNNDESKKEIILTKIKRYIQNHNNLASNSTADAKAASLNISVAPNPVNSVLTIKGLSASTKYAVRITNENGNTVANKQINNVSSYQINVQGLSAGVYYVKIISNNNQTTTLRFIKQ